MKTFSILIFMITALAISCKNSGKLSGGQLTGTRSIEKQRAVAKPAAENTLFIDEHDLQPGQVKFSDVQAAHLKDLAIQAKFGVDFKRFWVDEKNGKVYCLSSAKDSA